MSEPTQLEKSVTLVLNAFNSPRDEEGYRDCELRDAMAELEAAFLTTSLSRARPVVPEPPSRTAYPCPCCAGTGRLRDPEPGEMVDI